MNKWFWNSSQGTNSWTINRSAFIDWLHSWWRYFSFISLIVCFNYILILHIRNIVINLSFAQIEHTHFFLRYSPLHEWFCACFGYICFSTKFKDFSTWTRPSFLLVSELQGELRHLFIIFPLATNFPTLSCAWLMT